jgi:hypothetical protein
VIWSAVVITPRSLWPFEARTLTASIWPIVLTASQVVLMTPRVALAKGSAAWRIPSGHLDSFRLINSLLASFLFAVALVHANGPFLLTAVLPGVPAVLAPHHPPGLGEGEQTVR